MSIEGDFVVNYIKLICEKILSFFTDAIGTIVANLKNLAIPDKEALSDNNFKIYAEV